jgi:hypothetical protein
VARLLGDQVQDHEAKVAMSKEATEAAATPALAASAVFVAVLAPGEAAFGTVVVVWFESKHGCPCYTICSETI